MQIVRQYLPDHVRLSRAEAGCLSFDVSQTGLLDWQVDEAFADRAAFDAHQARSHASDWFRATALITRSYKITES